MKLKIIVKHPADAYEIRELTRLFITEEDFLVLTEEEANKSEEKADINILVHFQHTENETKLKLEKNGTTLKNMTTSFGLSSNPILQRKNEKNQLKRMMFQLLQSWYPRHLPWGILTGVRPVKIAHEMLRKEPDCHQAIENIQQDTLMSSEKAKLITDIAQLQKNYLDTLEPDAISLYINIPLCPTKCTYCSFASQALKSEDDPIIESYLRGLMIELETVLSGLKARNKKIRSLYIGGGTPSVMSAKQLNYFFLQLNSLWNLSQIDEITFEGGRPDTLTPEKLRLLAEYPIHRISVNPQTLHDRTLQKINRRHTVQDFFNVCNEAIKVGLDNINVDIIMGLPGETPDDFIQTLHQLQSLNLESLTVHSLAMKRTAGLKKQQYRFEWDDHQARSMMQQVYQFAELQKLEAYYLYRQKQILANMENVGFAKPDRACVYNILMMEEMQTVLGIGAGAVSKLVFPDQNRVQRVPGIKDILVYLNRMPEHENKWEHVLSQL